MNELAFVQLPPNAVESGRHPTGSVVSPPRTLEGASRRTWVSTGRFPGDAAHFYDNDSAT